MEREEQTIIGVGGRESGDKFAAVVLTIRVGIIGGSESESSERSQFPCVRQEIAIAVAQRRQNDGDRCAEGVAVADADRAAVGTAPSGVGRPDEPGKAPVRVP